MANIKVEPERLKTALKTRWVSPFMGAKKKIRVYDPTIMPADFTPKRNRRCDCRKQPVFTKFMYNINW